MPFKPVILYTDFLLFLLLAGVAAFAFYSLRHEHLRTPWRQVRRRPLAMAALVVLSVYMLVGLLDSLHLRLRADNPAPGVAAGQNHYSPEVLSVLDLLTDTLRRQREKTYSAPFALYGFTKEALEQPDGSQRRDYPRLRYGGAHLSHPQERAGDIARRVFIAALETLASGALLVLLATALFVRRPGEPFAAALARLGRGETDTPWRTILATLGLVLFLVWLLLNLAGHYHVLGTDQVGNDVLYKSLKSIRTGILIGTLTTLIMLPFAVALGVMAGYFRGWVDDVVQYLYTTLSSIPGVLLIAAAILSLDVYMANHPEDFASLVARSDMRLLFLCIILGITSWTTLCRLVRGETFKLREVDYVQAAQALGVRHRNIMRRHLLPNLMHIVLITVVLDFSALVLAEAVLSYIGIGVDPTMDSWGNMINGARLEMARDPMVWWSLGAAFVFMLGLVLSANLFSDAVRDAFDPRLRRR